MQKAEQVEVFKRAELTARPASGPRCCVCNKVLYHYEVKFGECLCHIKARASDWRNQPVRMTQAAIAAEG